MRGIMLRALPVSFVAFAVGCFSLGGSGSGPTVPAPSATHAYWQKVNEVLAQKPAGSEMKALVQLIRTQTDALRELDADGVDPALVAAVADVIKCEEEVLRRASIAGDDPTVLKTSEPMARAFADANHKAAEAKKRLRALRGPLNDRLGGGFAALGG